jgi:hypothetical protein
MWEERILPIVAGCWWYLEAFVVHVCNLNIGSTTVKQNAYKALVRPLVEYASPVWDPYHQTEIDRIEMVQRRAARYVLKKFALTDLRTNELSD